MNALELVEEMISALQGGDLELAANAMADSFEFTGFIPRALNRSQFLALQSELLTAMPDFSYNLSALRSDGDVVHATIRISGTQTHDLTLTLFGVEEIPATGLSISLPQTQVTFRINANKVSLMNVETVPGSGLSSLLQQVGTELSVLPREGDDTISG